MSATPDGIPDGAWEAIGATPEGVGWKIPERKADGEITGWSRRFADGRKGFVKGGKRGLTLRWPIDDYAGSSASDPVFIVEGATDTAAGVALSLTIVGRPSATGGAKLLAELLKGRHVCPVAENDGGPGERGARAIAAKLVEPCASVRIIAPPEGIKDLRAWIVGGATREDILECAAAATPLVQTGAPDVWDCQGARDCKTLDGSPSKLVMTNLANVEPQEVDWLWQDRIPAGMITVVAGHPGGGKSTFSVYVAAQVTTGRPWVDDPSATPREPGRVIFLTAEDDTSRVLVPRLISAGANRSLVEVIDGVRLTPDGYPALFDLDKDIDLLREAIQQRPDTRLIIIDPITAYLGSKARDSHNTAVMRGLLTPLKQLCEDTGCAVLVITHLNKSGTGASATLRITGSLALPAAARAVYLLETDPDDPERRLLLPDKMNVGPLPLGLAFGLDDRSPPAIVWEKEPLHMTAPDLLKQLARGNDGRSAADDEAVEWLRNRMADDSVPAKTVATDAKADGIGVRALGRAAGTLGVVKEPGEFGGPWVWRMPNAPSIAQSPTVSDTLTVSGREAS